jgi:hypothetical protein
MKRNIFSGTIQAEAVATTRANTQKLFLVELLSLYIAEKKKFPG